MTRQGRIVRVLYDNVMGEIVTEYLHGAKVRYVVGGIEFEENLTDEDYEYVDGIIYEDDL